MSLQHPEQSHPGPRPKRHYRAMNFRIAEVMRDLYFVGRLKQHEIGRMFGKRQGAVSRIVSSQVWSSHARQR